MRNQICLRWAAVIQGDWRSAACGWSKPRRAVERHPRTRSARAGIATARAELRSVEIGLADQTAKAVNEYRQARRLAEWYQELILPKARETVRVPQLEEFPRTQESPATTDLEFLKEREGGPPAGSLPVPIPRPGG